MNKSKIPWLPELKSKNCTVTRTKTYLATDTLPVVVKESVFPLLPLGRYLLPITTCNRYNPEIVLEISFIQLHLGKYLLSDMECLW